MVKRKKPKIITLILTMLVFLVAFSVPALVIFEEWDLSARAVSWILIFLLAFIGSERLFALLKNNNIWSIK